MFRFNINTIKFFLTFFIATMLFAVVQAYAVWQDAPAAPAQYGTTPGTTQDDYKPVNLGDTIQTKSGGLNIMGNVGIGTAPSFSIGRGLHISGVAGTPDAVIKLSETTSGLGNFELRSVARGTSGNRLEIGEGSDAFLTIRSDDDGGGTTLRGNIGIGQTNPATQLALAQDTGIISWGNNDGSTQRASIQGFSSNDLTFSILNSEKLRIQSSGNIGIGTTGPTYKLDVAGDVNITGTYRVNGTAISASGALTLDDITTNGNITSNNITVSRITASDFYDRQDANYYIDPAGATSAVLAGNVTASAFYVPSDARLKKNVETLSGALEKIQRARGVSYELANGQSARQIGVIAQELEQEFPELVMTDGNGYKAVAYDRLSAVLIEAVKELKEQNRILQSRLDLLEKKW